MGCTVHENQDLPGYDLTEVELGAPDIGQCCDSCTISAECHLAVLCGRSCWLKTKSLSDSVQPHAKRGCSLVIKSGDTDAADVATACEAVADAVSVSCTAAGDSDAVCASGFFRTDNVGSSDTCTACDAVADAVSVSCTAAGESDAECASGFFRTDETDSSDTCTACTSRSRRRSPRAPASS